MKPDADFALEQAPWPALLLEQNGKIVHANWVAVRVFGEDIEKEGASLAAVWSPDNTDSAEKFLFEPPRDEPQPLKFRLKNGMTALFQAQCCQAGASKLLLFQLFKEEVALPALPPPAESSLAHKQKLDCALQLARSVALDFNNALTSILGHASLLLGQAEANHPWRGSLAEIEKSASKAAEIASDLAAFSRQVKDTRAQTAGNLNTLLERAVEVFRGVDLKPIAWSLQFERRLFTASFDEAKMQQAFVKILENAVQAVKTDGRISVQTRNLELPEPTQDHTARLNAGNYVCVEISDNGDGIPAEVMPRIFEPFFTTKGSKHRGLGLAWVYGVVTNHGGGVAVSGQPGIGTSVRVYLPATRKIVRDTAPSSDDLGGKQTILFVDDEDLLLTMGQMVLSSFGYTVLTANSGHSANS